jgi:hypothetical protein
VCVVCTSSGRETCTDVREHLNVVHVRVCCMNCSVCWYILFNWFHVIFSFRLLYDIHSICYFVASGIDYMCVGVHQDGIDVHEQLDMVHRHVCCMKCSECATGARVSCPNHSSYVFMNLTVSFQDSINIVVSVRHGSNPGSLRHRRVYARWHSVWACVMFALQWRCNQYAHCSILNPITSFLVVLLLVS